MLPLTARTALFTIRSTSQFQCLILRQQCSRQRLAPTAHCVRPLSQSTHFSYPRKDAQDKDSINTEATEYSKSGTDDEGARQEDAAFDPNVTDPQDQKDVAGKDGNGEDS
ncbi:hypothetical protein MMC21_000944, partial [Puttea exsequens]|nr:hypothetical protein [Puttea exsequens]